MIVEKAESLLMKFKWKWNSHSPLQLCLDKFDDTHSCAGDVTDHHHGNICAPTNTGVAASLNVSGRRGNWLRAIRLSRIKVHSTTLAVAALVVERNIRINFPKSTKRESCIAEGWARLIFEMLLTFKTEFP